MSSQLPIELWESIVFHAEPEDQLALLITSHSLRYIAIRAYYRDITFDTPKQIERGFQTLISNRAAALAVRKFTIILT